MDCLDLEKHAAYRPRAIPLHANNVPRNCKQSQLWTSMKFAKQLQTVVKSLTMVKLV